MFLLLQVSVWHPGLRGSDVRQHQTARRDRTCLLRTSLSPRERFGGTRQSSAPGPAEVHHSAHEVPFTAAGERRSALRAGHPPAHAFSPAQREQRQMSQALSQEVVCTFGRVVSTPTGLAWQLLLPLVESEDTSPPEGR